jgi:methyltransferase (TIGR00027 family)
VRLGPVERARVAEQIDVIPLRVMAIDAEVDLAVGEGCAQVVLLGAGIDTRAYRLGALRSTHLFEVDHPATQAAKRKRAEGMKPISRELTYVPVDFERDGLATALRAAGHDASAPSVWVWEGVVMYLSDAAMRSTLRAIRERSAPASVLVVHYHEPDQGPRSRIWGWLLSSLWREPQIGLRTRARMIEELTRAGFEVARDTGTVDWATRFGGAPRNSATARVARLAVARPAGPSP